MCCGLHRFQIYRKLKTEEKKYAKILAEVKYQIGDIFGKSDVRPCSEFHN